MRARFPLAFAAGLALHGGALAADLTVVVTDAAGKPVADAVAILDAPVARAPAAGSFTINQKDMQFVPQVLVIPAGSTVEFGNLDPFRHHVYSFSPARRTDTLRSARRLPFSMSASEVPR